MTKVSWKRILQRAGNDLPSTGSPPGERPQLQSVPWVSQRSTPMIEGPTLVAGELETELRRALRHARDVSGPEAQNPSWDPILVAQGLPHRMISPVAVAAYTPAPIKPRGTAMRNILAVSLSAVVVGFAVQQIGAQWHNSKGGGGGGNGGGQYRASETEAIAAPMKARERGQLMQTGYAIQPANPGSPIDLAPADNGATQARNEARKPASQHSEAASTFRLDIEEARKVFDSPKKAPAASARTAAVAPAEVAPRAAKPAPALPALASGEESKLLQRAGGLMRRGDITGARLLFEHLANRGSALGAFALAQSYDARSLEKRGVRGLAPDEKQANYWYRRAAELGGDTTQGGRSSR